MTFLASNTSNTLLYRYDVGVEAIRQSPAAATCEATFAGFGRQAFALGSATVAGFAVPGPLGDAAQLASGLIREELDQSGFGFSPSAEAVLDQAQVRLDEIALDSRELVEMGGSLFDSLSTIALEADISPLEERLQVMRSAMEDEVAGSSSLAGAARHYQDILSALGAVEEQVFGITDVSVSARSAEVMAAVARQEEATRGARTAHLDALRLVERAEAEGRRAYALRNTSDTFFGVSITRTASVDDRLAAEALLEGAYDMFVRPSRPTFSCQLGIALLWSENNPVYGIDDEGQLEDARTRNSRFSPNLLFSLSPRAFEAVSLNLGVGMGELDAPDFLLGISLKTIGGLRVGGGIMWKRAPKLPTGTVLGTVVQDLSLDDLSEPYVTTPYFGILF